MPTFCSSLIVEQHVDGFQQETSLWQDRELAVFGYSYQHEGQALDALVFKVRRNPKDLLTHLRRIYFCYEKCLSAQLYAALLDLLIVLQGRGQAISRRMIEASRTQLNSRQLQLLNQSAGHELLGNTYSLFSNGYIGYSELVESKEQTETQHDFLTLANDFIEYSQLEQAMDVLETGISLHPDRQDFQHALLELYKSTGNRERFQTHRQTFSDSGILLADEWLDLAHFFEGQAS
ncbi:MULTISPECIES: FimV family protein [Methylomonas]|uniref:Tetratricopeptide repeat protein n=2 Tax=Methylomonas TaxID=416 RepID=A0A140E6L2_9GAMM|nr:MULTISPECIES: hypothetical protein [Methylomonas]AMK79036.1 hypothetical protein JT25_021550 [Methylomonas denitrificans]OAI00199.1 hypothetical protein A1342_01375 [Methylomonas methanica]TCV79171.1 hypothetical protein EDE11_12145 [Methylomonas methanica]